MSGGEWNNAIGLEQASRAGKEYLATLDDQAFGTASGVIPKFIVPADWRRNGPARYKMLLSSPTPITTSLM